MLQFLKNKKFNGDLSLQDADIIVQLASAASSILEFGAGGSTQLIAQCNPVQFVCVEDLPIWKDRTIHNLAKIDKDLVVTFIDYDGFPELIGDTLFDLILVDGDIRRPDFALATWKNLKIGGKMVFHDTRVLSDFRFALTVTEKFFEEISTVEINLPASDGIESNLTVLTKKQYIQYVNWTLVENKPLWAYSYTDWPSLNYPVWMQR